MRYDCEQCSCFRGCNVSDFLAAVVALVHALPQAGAKSRSGLTSLAGVPAPIRPPVARLAPMPLASTVGSPSPPMVDAALLSARRDQPGFGDQQALLAVQLENARKEVGRNVDLAWGFTRPRSYPFACIDM
jgi:hypothetical protein